MPAKLDLAQFQGFTPGQWEVAKAGLTEEGIRFVITGAGDAVCRLQSRPLGESMPANAALIAAAPSILAYARELEQRNAKLAAALEKMHDWAERFVPFSKGHLGLDNDLREASTLLAENEPAP